MKRYTIVAYVVLLITVLASGFFIYKVSGKNGADDNIKKKTLSGVKHLQSEFSNLFNELNNIKFENYEISATEIQEEETENQSSSSSQVSTGNGGGSGKSSQSGDSSGSQGVGGEANVSKNNKQYELKETGILTKDSEINWNQIKINVEKMYTSLYSTTLDLYKTTTNQEDIANFNKEYDSLTKAVKEEDKEKTLNELSKLYDYLPKFVENCTDEEKEKVVIRTKNNIFKAYSVLDKEDWTMILQNINAAIQEFRKLVTDMNSQEDGNKYNINKSYVMINELQNATNLKDKEVFLIKYKNVLEELENI